MKQLKRIWQKLASLSLSVWLLIISALIILINSEVATRCPQPYQRLNATPLWTWLGQVRQSDPFVFTALILLIVSLGVLALNTLACTINRLGELSRPKGKKGGPGKTLVTWAPTLMHILFFLLLAGHMAAFSFGESKHHTVKQGESLYFAADASPITITSFSRTIRQIKGPLHGSTVSHQVEVKIEGNRAVISEMQPLKLANGHWLIFLPPQQKDKKGPVPVDEPVDCSGEERQVKAIPFDPGQPIKLKQVFDPSIYFLFIAFGLILVLLSLHYTITWQRKGLR